MGSLAYYHKGVGSDENEDAISSIILGTSLLTARGTPVAGEYEIKNAQAMKIMDSFGAGGSFTEYYAVDYNGDVLLMGHDGPGHIAIAEGKTKVPARCLSRQGRTGTLGRNVSQHGPVTPLSVVKTADGKLELLVAEGESVAGPIPNRQHEQPIPLFNWRQALSQRMECASTGSSLRRGRGHILSKLKKLGALLGMECIRVCWIPFASPGMWALSSLAFCTAER